MALSLDQLQAMRDKLTAALGSPVLEVTIDGMTTKYTSVADIERRRAIIDADIAKLSSGSTRSYSLAQFSKDGRGNNQNG